MTSRAVPRRSKDEGEKPFWISFADLMTGLMVLFLVVMSVALLAVTKNVSEKERAEELRRQDIEKVLDRIEAASKDYPGIVIDRARKVVDYGELARFQFGRFILTQEQSSVVRKFVPIILSEADSEVGKRVFKRVVVEGYTDNKGTYLSNLNLSLLRSQSVLCAMFDSTGPNLLSESQKELVRDLFLVGGYSFNATKSSDEESRRVELKLEFLEVGQARLQSPTSTGNFGECAIK